MGLAASQARFLAITSRKANCEFQSMEIAQQKLSVTRDLQTATNNYQSKLNATMLVWDESGSGQGETPLQLTYDIMMTPSEMNGYDPYLLTDRSGRIVLNGRMAEAAKAISPRGIPITRSVENRKEFLEALSVTGYIAGSMKDKILYDPKTKELRKDNYIRGAGMGSAPLDKTAANAVTINTLAEVFSDPEKYSLNLTTLIPDGTSLNLGNGTTTTVNWDDSGTATSGNVISLIKNGKVVSKDELATLTLGDLLTGQYTLMAATGDNQNAVGGYIPGVVDQVNNKEGLLYQIAHMLGLGQTEGTGLNVDSASAKALEFAMQQTLLVFNPKKSTKLGDPNSTSKSYKGVKNGASQYNGFVATDDGNLNKHENTHVGVSLSNMVSTFLTYYAAALDGYKGAYTIASKAEDSNYVTSDTNYYYVTNNDGAVTEKDLLMTDFYNMLYNNICAYGWTTNENLDDPEYLSHAVKNGQVFISSLANDGRYYQGAYTENGYVVEIQDEDAITEAELEYTNIKAKLNYKEEKLELDMKNLDLEISSLTTEYDTVKNLLGKNVEKIFNMFGT